MQTRARSFILAGILVVALAACGGGGDDDDGVATLDRSSADDNGATDDSASDDDAADDEGGGGQGGVTPSSPEFQDAMLEYAECMRDQGIDFPDPQFEDGGGLVIAGPRDDGGPPSQAEMDEFEKADEECRHLLEDVMEDMPAPDPEQQAEMQDDALAFAECMRDHGIDFPDPQFEEGGRVRIGLGEGIDPSDPDFQEAQEECAGEDGGVFSVGGGPGGGPDVEAEDG